MKKNKQIRVKIYAFNQSNIKVVDTIDAKGKERCRCKFDLKGKGEEDFQISIQENFFLRAYAIYANRDFTDGMEISEIIKVKMPSDKNKRNAILSYGISTTSNGTYRAYIATPSQMKHEDSQRKELGEMWFVKGLEDFKVWLEKLISMDQFDKHFNKDADVKITKDVTSRIALTFSNTHKLDLKPRIIVVSDSKYPFKGLYQHVEMVANKDGVMLPVIEKNSVKLSEPKIETKEFTSHDGMGLMTQAFAKKIQEAMELEHDVYWAVIRMYNGLAIKGSVVSIDMVQYVDEFNDGNTSLVDIWGNEQDLRDCDLLLTESMVKWWKLFKNDTELNGMKLVNSQLDRLSKKNRSLVDCLYVTKVNKDKEEIAKMTMSNYQLFSNVAMNYETLKEIGTENFNYYKSIINASDINDVLHFLKTFTDEEKLIAEQEVGDGEAADNPDLDSQYLFIPSTICDDILHKNEELLKLKTVKRYLRNLVEKKVKDLASGRTMIDATYSLMSQCPFTLLNNALKIEDKTAELKAGEFFINGIEVGSEIALQRCPNASYDEIIKVITSTNVSYEKYLSHLGRDIIVYNAKDNTAERQSGADFDGDQSLVVTDKRIIDAVIESDIAFEQTYTLDPKESKFTIGNSYLITLDNSGNLIGKISLHSFKVANECLALKNKEDIIAEFNKNKGLFYYLVQLGMQSIDAPKVGQKPHKLQLELLDEITGNNPYMMKYRDMSKMGDKYVSGAKKYEKVTNSCLDRYAEYVMENLLKIIWEMNEDEDGIARNKSKTNDKKTKTNNDATELLVSKIRVTTSEFIDVESEEYIRCQKELRSFNNFVRDQSFEINSNMSCEIKPLIDRNKTMTENVKSKWIDLKNYDEGSGTWIVIKGQINDIDKAIKSNKKSIKKIKEKYSLIRLENKVENLEKARIIREKYPSHIIATILKTKYEATTSSGKKESNRKFTEKIIISYFYDCIKDYIGNEKGTMRLLEKVSDETTDVEYEQFGVKYSIKAKKIVQENHDFGTQKEMEALKKAISLGIDLSQTLFDLDAIIFVGDREVVIPKLENDILNVAKRSDVENESEYGKYGDTIAVYDSEMMILGIVRNSQLDANTRLECFKKIKIEDGKTTARSMNRIKIRIVE